VAEQPEHGTKQKFDHGIRESSYYENRPSEPAWWHPLKRNFVLQSKEKTAKRRGLKQIGNLKTKRKLRLSLKTQEKEDSVLTAEKKGSKGDLGGFSPRGKPKVR